MAKLNRFLLISTILLLIICFALAVLLNDDWSSPSRDYPPYTNGLIRLAEHATQGDANAAKVAWDDCASIQKIDRFDNRNNTIGLCSNFLYLYIENTINEGDPEKFRSAMGLLRNGGSPGFGERLDIYKKIGRIVIRNACSGVRPPKSCGDPEVMAWLGLPESIPDAELR